MDYYSHSVSFENLLITSPLIVIVVLWSEILVNYISSNKVREIKTEAFNRDLFLISFSFILSALIAFVLEYKNSDVLGWWPFALYFISIYGFLFSLIFSLVALIINNHKNYTFFIFVIIVILMPTLNFLPHYVHVYFIENIETFYLATGALMVVYLLLCFSWKRSKK